MDQPLARPVVSVPVAGGWPRYGENTHPKHAPPVLFR
jgi:hypothetical protein